jgi:hypothetical protein
MAKTTTTKSSNGFIYFILFLFIIGFFVALYFGWQYFKNTYAPQEAKDKIAELEAEKTKLQYEVNAIKLEQFRKTWQPIIITAIIALVIGWIIIAWIKSNPRDARKVLTIDEAKNKGYDLVQQITGQRPLWCMADATERKVGGGNKFYLLNYGFYPRKGNHSVYWNMTKIIGIINDDWDHGRIENIPSGLTIINAVQHVLAEMDMKGYAVQKEPKTADIEAIGEAMQRKRQSDEAFKSLGLVEDDE